MYEEAVNVFDGREDTLYPFFSIDLTSAHTKTCLRMAT
jgi:hypothetical protein